LYFKKVKTLDIEKKLINVKYKTDETPHLILNQEICKVCEDRVCLNICPANVYKKCVSGENSKDGAPNDDTIDCIMAEYENCLECGACRVACPYGAIEWKYPKAGCGVMYKFS